MRSCPKCGGELYGDGYTSVIRCEFADEEKINGVEPDANPVYCDHDEVISDESIRHYSSRV